MTARDYQLLNLRYSCPLLRRDEILEGKVPTAPTIASMMAALEVQEALKLIHGLPVAAGSAHGLQRRDEPVLHDAAPVPRRLPEPRDLPRAGRAAARPRRDGRRAVRGGPAHGRAARSPWRWTATWSSPSTARAAAGAPRSSGRGRKVRDGRGRLPELPRAGAARDRQRRSRRRRPWPTRPLAALGIPPYDIVRVDGDGALGLLPAGRRPRRRGESGWSGDRRRASSRRGGQALSQDEIVFDEIRYREPRAAAPARPRPPLRLPGVRGPRARRPADLPRPRAPPTRSSGTPCATRRSSSAASCSARSASTTRRASRSSGSRKSLEAKHYENTQASFTYTHDSWEEITRERDRLHPDLDIVGWYHTHPDFGIFLSQPRPVHPPALLRPAAPGGLRGRPDPPDPRLLPWRDGELEQVGGFYLTADRGDRIALARLVNDLENIPNPDGGGGGLSPRLEAELITMLTRPATQHPAPPPPTGPDRHALRPARHDARRARAGRRPLAQRSQRQHRRNRAARSTTSASRSTRRPTASASPLDTALGEAGGTNPERVRQATTPAPPASATTPSASTRTRSPSTTWLAAKFKLAAEDLATLQAKYDDIKQVREGRQGDGRPSACASKTSVEQASARPGRSPSSRTCSIPPRAARPSRMAHRYQNTWYACIAGWSVSAVLAPRPCSEVYAYLKLPPEDVDEPTPTPRAGEGPPPHRIT